MTELTPIRRGRCAGAGNWQTQYQALQMTAREAAELIRDGDTAAFAAMSNWPWELDGALAISPSAGTSSPPEPGC